MGRRNRERIARIIAGKELSLREEKDFLMNAVARRAIPTLFAKYFERDDTFDKNRPDWSEEERDAAFQELGKQMREDTVTAIVDELPDVLPLVHRSMFHINEISAEKDHRDIAGGIIYGAVGGSIKFGIKRRRGETEDVFHLKKRAGKPRSGTWKFCAQCGTPIYVTKSNEGRTFHNRDCYKAFLRMKRVLTNQYLEALGKRRDLASKLMRLTAEEAAELEQAEVEQEKTASVPKPPPVLPPQREQQKIEGAWDWASSVGLRDSPR